MAIRSVDQRVGATASGNTRPLAIVGVASALGVNDPACAKGPGYLHNLYTATEIIGPARASWYRTVRAADYPSGTVVEQLADLCADLAQDICSLILHRQRFAVIGGDHSCAIGTWSGAAMACHPNPIGLIWIDAHMDSHTPATSPSRSLHGMPLAHLLGEGDPLLSDLAYAGPKLDPARVCIVGVRSFEQEEKALLERKGVTIRYMSEIEDRGFEQVFKEAVAHVSRDTAGFGVSIDLDAIDPRDAPAVNTPEAGGITGQALLDALQQLASNPDLMGIEIAEFTPMNDKDHQTADLVTHFIDALVAMRMK